MSPRDPRIVPAVMVCPECGCAVVEVVAAPLSQRMGQQVKDLLEFNLHLVLVAVAPGGYRAQFECPVMLSRRARILPQWDKWPQLPGPDDKFVGLVALGEAEVRQYEARRAARMGEGKASAGAKTPARSSRS